MIQIPPYLKPGDRIGITCPAGYMALENAEACIQILQQEGYEVLVGKTLGSKSTNYFSDTDENRLDELQAMLNDRSIKAILCGRGGYGTTRIIDRLKFTAYKKNPKWIIGFSDITTLHLHILGNYQIAGLHAPMAGAFKSGIDPFNQSMLDALKGKKTSYKIDSNPFNKKGSARGKLIGGNLTLLANCIGTDSDFDTRNAILFIEETGEYIYAIDRLLHQLKRNGKFKKPAAIIFGGFTSVKDTERPFGKSIEEVLAQISENLDIPICYNFPVSHEKENLALKIGVTHQLSITAKQVRLIEC